MFDMENKKIIYGANRRWRYVGEDNKIQRDNFASVKNDTEAEFFEIDPFLSGILENRGISSLDEVKRFLAPKLSDMHSPLLLKDMKKAAERVYNAIQKKERVLVYGDYDVDGITSTTILTHFLKSKGVDTHYFIPDRIDEGYGLTPSTVGKVIDLCPTLVVTVDCGVSALDEVANLNSQGIDVVITDHHECGSLLPNALAVVNPHRHDCEYPFKELAGVGVAFKLILAVNDILVERGASQPGYVNRELPSWYLELVCIGTIGDIVSLLDENRVIVKYGLESMQHTQNFGISALLDVSDIKTHLLDTWSVGFGISPRINAAGRMGSAQKAVEMLLATDFDDAYNIAKFLNDENVRRQKTESEILANAIEKVQTEIDLDMQRVIVLWGEGWHHGVIGIVASRLVEKFSRPCVLLCVEGEQSKGSARSIKSLNIYEAFLANKHIIERFGGHELAAGLTVKTKNLPELREALNKYAELNMDTQNIGGIINIEMDIEEQDITYDNARKLKKLEPYGTGNDRPIFAYNNARVIEIKKVGNDRHLKLKLSSADTSVDAIAFNLAGAADVFEAGDRIEIACSLDINSWNNKESIQLIVKDMRLSRKELKQKQIYETIDNEYLTYIKKSLDCIKKLSEICYTDIESLIPSRDDLAIVYKYIRDNEKKGIWKDIVICKTPYGSFLDSTYDWFFESIIIKRTAKTNFNLFKLKRCVEILFELDLIVINEEGVRLCNESGEKVNLTSSIIYSKLQQLAISI